MTWVAVGVQLLVPVAMLAWLAFARVRSAATVLGAILALAGFLLTVALAVPALFLPWWLPVLLAAITLLVIVIRVPAWRRSAAGAWPVTLGGWLLLAAWGCVAGATAVLVVAAVDGRRLPEADTIDLPVPLEPGTYLVANGGSREVVNAHMLTLDASVQRFREYRGQSYGVDLVEIDALGRRSHGLQPADPAAYAIYGNLVYAPCSGEVVSSRNDRPDMPVPEKDVDVMEGNHVLLRCADADVLLAHFIPGSVRVETGDHASAGQPLARVGNSGNSAEPHLHISAQRPGSTSQPLSGEPMAILFDGKQPVRNMRLRVAMTAGGQARRDIGKAGLEERLAAELGALVREYGLPGAVAAGVIADGTVAVAAAGYADLESAAPMTPASRMLAASIGKTFVSATVLALEAEGFLGLDDPLARWLGDRAWYARLPNNAKVTLRQLLMHTSGIADHVQTSGFAEAFVRRLPVDAEPLSPEELVGFVLDRPALFAAGQGWSYTDTGYILLGMVIEEATGNRYYDEVARRFLGPLSLDLTSPADRREIPGLASGYTSVDNPFGLPPKLMLGGNRLAWHPGIEWTGGGLVSNARDLAAWARALFEGNAMEHDYLDELLRSVPMDPEVPGRRYGAGVAIYESEEHGTVFGHSGWVPGYVSFVRYLADTQSALAFQANTDAGLLDGDSPAMADIEARLTAVVTAGR